MLIESVPGNSSGIYAKTDLNYMKSRISVENGVKIAIRHPSSGEGILAKTLASYLNRQDWLNDEFKLRFCIKFVENLIDGSVEKSVDCKILEKLKKCSFTDGIRFLKKRPKEGIKYLVVMVMEELRHRQNFTEEQQFQFYEELLASFFPSHQVSDFIDTK